MALSYDAKGSDTIPIKSRERNDDDLWELRENITKTIFIPPGGRYVARIDNTGQLFEVDAFPSLSTEVLEALNLTPPG